MKIATDGTRSCRGLQQKSTGPIIGRLRLRGKLAGRMNVRSFRDVHILLFTLHASDLSFVKRKTDPKCCALVDGTLYNNGPAMFFDDTFYDREA